MRSSLHFLFLVRVEFFPRSYFVSDVCLLAHLNARGTIQPAMQVQREIREGRKMNYFSFQLSLLPTIMFFTIWLQHSLEFGEIPFSGQDIIFGDKNKQTNKQQNKKRSGASEARKHNMRQEENEKKGIRNAVRITQKRNNSERERMGR
ncbi:Hypothetical protein, putative [Bodo saltans]|uniref:Uncharacterized protein n=1 Tax=Bodo saltans TaxID=75058 RepID=A0A0S4J647_BODSA|nr:Hypothetical protein, putative [Bodo saltans]|eukprot:CUG84875.1 Hypothetical protein, putative [Bodo saltans]